MTKLNWEKDPMAQIVRHQKKRQTEKNHLKGKAARLRKLEKQLQAPYQSGIQVGEQRERERIIKLLIDKAIEWRNADLHQQANYLDFAVELIKGEQK